MATLERGRAEGGQLVAAVGFAESSVRDARLPEFAGGQLQRRFIRDFQQHQMGMVAIGRDEPLPPGLDRGVDGLDGALGGREVGSY